MVDASISREFIGAEERKDAAERRCAADLWLDVDQGIEDTFREKESGFLESKCLPKPRSAVGWLKRSVGISRCFAIR
jgi:hypothetical protein